MQDPQLNNNAKKNFLQCLDKDLKSITLRNRYNNFKEQDMYQLILFLNQHPEVKELDGGNVKFDKKCIEMLATNTTLTSLYLYCSNVGDEGAKLLSNHNALTFLNLNITNIGVNGARALSSNTRLRSLLLSNNNIGDEGAKAFSHNSTLTYLDLTRNAVGSDGASALLNNPILTELYLDYNHITDSGVKAFPKNTNLIRISLDNNQIGAEGAELISKNTTLKSLTLHGNNIGVEGAKSFSKNTTLMELRLGDSNVGDEGVRALANNSTLTSLSLISAGVSNAGSKALSTNTTLTELNLGFNNLDANDAKELSNNTSLSSLELPQNSIDDVGAEYLAYNTTLTSLNLSHNKFGNIGAAALAANSTLTYLLVNLPSVKKAAFPNLVKKICENERLQEIRRNNLMQFFTVLAHDRFRPNDQSKSFLAQLPLDVILYILNFLVISDSGKNPKQIQACLQFIFNNVELLLQLLKNKHKVSILENKTSHNFKIISPTKPFLVRSLLEFFKIDALYPSLILSYGRTSIEKLQVLGLVVDYILKANDSIIKEDLVAMLRAQRMHSHYFPGADAYLNALIAQCEGKNSTAVNILEAWITENKTAKSSFIWYRLGIINQQLGDYEQAFLCLETAVKKNDVISNVSLGISNLSLSDEVVELDCSCLSLGNELVELYYSWQKANDQKKLSPSDNCHKLISLIKEIPTQELTASIHNKLVATLTVENNLKYLLWKTLINPKLSVSHKKQILTDMLADQTENLQNDGMKYINEHPIAKKENLTLCVKPVRNNGTQFKIEQADQLLSEGKKAEAKNILTEPKPMPLYNLFKGSYVFMQKYQFFQENKSVNYLEMSYQEFDQEKNGWRSVAKKNNYEEAGQLILQYLAEKKQLNDFEIGNLYFHAGQMFAFNNNIEKAVHCFKNSFLPNEAPDAPVKWNVYVRGTIAFLNKDFKILSECIEEVSKGKEIAGIIPNLDYLKNFALNLNWSYKEVYQLSSSKTSESRNCLQS